MTTPLISYRKYKQNKKKSKRIAAILAIMMLIISVLDYFSGTFASAASSHSTRLYLSSEQIKQKENITLTADAIENGSAVTNGYTYRFLYNTNGSSTSAFPLGDYSSRNWYSFKPSEISGLKDYTGPVFLYADSKKNGVNVWSSYKIINILPNDEESLKATGTVTSAGNYVVGEKLIVTMTASGGNAPYKYKYQYCRSGGNYETHMDDTKISSVTIPTDDWSANTDYYIKVTVTDSSSKTFEYVSAVLLSEKPIPIPSISSFSVQNTARSGEKIQLNCDAIGGSGELQYKFTYINSNNEEKTIRAYNESDNTTWDTKGLEEGSYTVKVTVKDGNKNTVSQKATVKISKAPTLSPTITTDPSNGTVVKGKDITFTVDTHSDGTENYPPQPYKYTFEYKKTSESRYSPLSVYSDSEKYKYNTKNLEAGDYELKVTVEDNNGDEYSKTVKFTVEVPKITFSVDPGSKDFFTGGGNDKAVIEVKNVKGGTSEEYEYKFEYVKYGSLTDTTLTPPNDSSSWKKIKDFGGESSSDFTVKDDDQAGIYAVRVSVQNKGNTNNSLVYRQIILGYTVKIKIKHTLEDINMLVNKVDTWMSTAFYGDMFDQVKAWSPENEEYHKYPFNYEDFSEAYQNAKDCNTNGNKDYDTVYSKLETEFTKLQNLVSSGCVSANPLSIAPYSKGFTDSVLFLFKSMVGGISELFKYAVGEGNSIFYSFDYNEVADFIFPLFKTFAYALIIIFAGVNALETALQYEMFTLRGGVKILGRLVLAKVWVDISLLVCRAIVSIAVGWMSQISILTTDIAEYIHIDIPISGSSGSPSFITGHIFDWLNMQILSINISLLILPLIIMVIIIYIKLFIRSFELAMLQCVSPVFFACLTGETTKQYFKKFIMTYISVAFEVVFMALIWYIYVEYLNQSFNHQIETLTVESMEELFSMESGVFNFFMVSVGAFILMIKPPQVLKNLIRE